jgi:hypothetical protein
MENPLVIVEAFLVKHLYKWILPLVVLVLTVFVAEGGQGSGVKIVLALWLCIAYVSIPLNFEYPSETRLAFYLKRSTGSMALVLMQVSALSLGVAGATYLLVRWYLVGARELAGFFGVLNGLAYGGTVLLACSLLRQDRGV